MDDAVSFYGLSFLAVQAFLFFPQTRFIARSISHRLAITAVMLLFIPGFIAGVISAIIMIPLGLLMVLEVGRFDHIGGSETIRNADLSK